MLRDENTDNDSLCDDARLYFLNDANMNVTSMVDTNGDAIERYVYDPYGKVTIYDGTWSSTCSTSSYSNTVLYTGRDLEPETLLYFYRARQYSAELGRFVSRDPIGYQAHEWNLYGYVRGTPSAMTDPRGLTTLEMKHCVCYVRLYFWALFAFHARNGFSKCGQEKDEQGNPLYKTYDDLEACVKRYLKKKRLEPKRIAEINMGSKHVTKMPKPIKGDPCSNLYVDGFQVHEGRHKQQKNLTEWVPNEIEAYDAQRHFYLTTMRELYAMCTTPEQRWLDSLSLSYCLGSPSRRGDDALLRIRSRLFPPRSPLRMRLRSQLTSRYLKCRTFPFPESPPFTPIPE